MELTFAQLEKSAAENGLCAYCCGDSFSTIREELQAVAIIFLCFLTSFFLLYFPHAIRRTTSHYRRTKHKAKGHLQGFGTFAELHE